MDATSGELRFLQAPDFEQRLDSDNGNDYEVTVRASDGSFFSDQNFTFDIINKEDPPEIDLIGVTGITGNSAVIEGNLTAFTGNQPQVILYYDDNASYYSSCPIPLLLTICKAKYQFGSMLTILPVFNITLGQ